MTKTTQYIGILSLFTLLMSCNIKAPIQEILWEGNRQIASEIFLNQGRDTISPTRILSISKYDSLSSATLTVKTITESEGNVLLENYGKEKLHTVDVWDNGSKATLVAYQSNDTLHTALRFKSFLNNVLFVSGTVTQVKVVVMWQNTLLPDRFIETDQKGLSVFIPKEAKSIPESVLRIFVVNRQGKIEKLAIRLNAGQPVI